MDDDAETLAGGNPGAVTVHAGFPNPAAERHGSPLDLNRLLIKHPSSTYFFRIRGETWEDIGIFDGDIAIIDRALAPRRSDLVITWERDSFRLQHWRHWHTGDEPWGVVSSIIHPYET
ncbi:MAG TPA: S24 family peptidase [Candidatus Saccharimonadales bacterium]